MPDMIYRRLGGSGLRVSVCAFGTWRTFGGSVDQVDAERIVHEAYDAGITYFDGAEIYAEGQADMMLGQILQRSGWPREHYVVSGKVRTQTMPGTPRPTACGLNRKHLRDCCDRTLRNYGTDYLDLFFCHRPDPHTPLLETAQAMNELIRQGKILYWGTSCFSAAQLAELYGLCDRHGLIPPTAEQSRYNLLRPEALDSELAPFIAARGLGTTVYSPLAAGALVQKRFDAAGKPITDGLAPGRATQLERAVGLLPLAAELGVRLEQLALAWVLSNQAVSTAILGASAPGQLSGNLAALDLLERMDDKLRARIAAAIA